MKKFKKVNTFKEFCEIVHTPEEAMQYFIDNKIVWDNGKPKKKPNDGFDYVIWCDKLLKDNCGICFDQTVLMHYFLNHLNIENSVGFMWWISQDQTIINGHIIPMYKYDGKIYSWLYLGPGKGIISGPYRSYEEATDLCADCYKVLTINSTYNQASSKITHILNSDDLKAMDKYYNKKNVSQLSIIKDSSKMLYLKVKSIFKYVDINSNIKQYMQPTINEAEAIISNFKQNNLIVSLFDEIKNFFEDSSLVTSDNGTKLKPELQLANNYYMKKFKKVNTFKEFCEIVHTPEEAMQYFIDVGIDWYDKSNPKLTEGSTLDYTYYRYPDLLLKSNIGICLDQAIFMHYFFDYINIENTIAFFATYQVKGFKNDQWDYMGHMYPLFKINNRVYAWLYFSKSNGKIVGPFRDYKSAGEILSGFMEMSYRQDSILNFKKISYEVPEWKLKTLEKYFNRSVLQKDLLFDLDKYLYSLARITHFETIVKFKLSKLFNEDTSLVTSDDGNLSGIDTVNYGVNSPYGTKLKPELQLASDEFFNEIEESLSEKDIVTETEELLKEFSVAGVAQVATLNGTAFNNPFRDPDHVEPDLDNDLTEEPFNVFDANAFNLNTNEPHDTFFHMQQEASDDLGDTIFNYYDDIDSFIMEDEEI